MDRIGRSKWALWWSRLVDWILLGDLECRFEEVAVGNAVRRLVRQPLADLAHTDIACLFEMVLQVRLLGYPEMTSLERYAPRPWWIASKEEEAPGRSMQPPPLRRGGRERRQPTEWWMVSTEAEAPASLTRARFRECTKCDGPKVRRPHHEEPSRAPPRRV